MDRQERKILLEELNELIAEERFEEAAEVADQIDWRRESKAGRLAQISDLYRTNYRYEDALDIMLLAYKRNPDSRKIIYNVCELYIENGDLASALEFHRRYCELAPNSTEALILEYKLLELENASLETKIELLERLCRKDYSRQEWIYQLAYLYHRIGFATKCVEECDKMITWFHNGPFVIKAMELKMLHARLTTSQQEIYDARDQISDELEAYESDEYTVERPDPALGEEDFRVKTIDMSKFNTINLQKALAESMREILGGEEPSQENARITGEILGPMLDDDLLPEEQARYEEDAYYEDDGYAPREERAGEAYAGDEYMGDEEYDPEAGYASEDGYAEGEYYDEEYPDDGTYVADSEYAEDRGYAEEGTYASDGEYAEDRGYADEDTYAADGEYGDEGYPEEDEGNTIYLRPDELRQMTGPVSSAPEADPSQSPAASVGENEVFFEDRTSDIIVDSPPAGTNPAYESLHQIAEEVRREEIAEKPEVREARPRSAGKRNMDELLYQGTDGQIGLAVPAEAVIEREMTGQINLDDYMAGWEERKRRKEEKRKQENAKKLKEDTGKIFAQYKEEHQDDLIEELEKEHRSYTEKYRADDIELRSIGEVAADNAAQAQSKGSIWDEVEEEKAARAAKAASGTSIWDEVDKARAAGQPELEFVEAGSRTAEAVTGANVVQLSTGVLDGFVDAAAAAAEGLVQEAQGLPAVQEYEEEDAPAEEKTEAAAEKSESAEPEASETYPENTEYEAEPGGYPEDAEYEEEPGEYPEDAEYEEEPGEYPEDAEYEEEPSEYPEDAEYEEAPGGYPEDAEYEEEPGEYPEDAEYEEAPGEYPEDAEYDAAATGGMNTAQMEEIAGVLEADADRIGVETVSELNDEYDVKAGENDFSVEEQKLFGDFLYSKKLHDQILETIDQISLAPYVGNVIITGENETGILQLGKAIVKELQMIDSNFISTRVAKISGTKMNQRDIPAMLAQLVNGALLIERAADMVQETVELLMSTLEGMQDGILVILMDEKKEMELMIDESPMLEGYFNTRIDIVPMNNNALVEYAKKYAYSREYKIDEERGVLALHQRISELQIGEHHVTTREVEDIVEDAIAKTSKPRLGTFFALLSGKRYDYEDMIVLREEDFS